MPALRCPFRRWNRGCSRAAKRYLVHCFGSRNKGHRFAVAAWKYVSLKRWNYEIRSSRTMNHVPLKRWNYEIRSSRTMKLWNMFLLNDEIMKYVSLERWNYEICSSWTMKSWNMFLLNDGIMKYDRLNYILNGPILASVVVHQFWCQHAFQKHV